MNGSTGPSLTTNRSGFFIAGVLVSLIVGFLIGRGATGPTVRTIDDAIQRFTKSETPADFNILVDAWNLVQSRYVGRPVDNATLVRGAVDGLVTSLDDPYSFFLPPAAADSFQDEINGKFQGIGAELGQKDGRTVIIAPLPDTPAERSGLQAGDVIVKVDDQVTDGQTLDEVVRRIRGAEGTSVKLEISRSNEPAIILNITRAKIQVKSVKLEYRETSGKQIGLIKISSFTQTTASEFSSAVQSILLKQPAGLIIDLRNNPGGYLDAAVDVADAFLVDGAILIEDYGNSRTNTVSADDAAPLAGMRTVVLVDEGSASAAEILAGALRDRLQAPLIGEKTFGKGSVQEIEDLPDGSTLKLTVAHWLTPNGTSIDKTGLQPDLVIVGSETPAETDPQLDAALERLSK